MTIGVNDELGNELLKRPGFRKATELEAVKATPIKPTEAGFFVSFFTHTAMNDGYGESANGIINGLTARGVGLAKDANGPLAFVYGTPALMHKVTKSHVLLFTMFESTSIPDAWVDELRKAWRVLVPSKFCQAAFLTKGIHTEVVPVGYNADIYKPIERPQRPVFTFLHYNAFNVRKGFDLVFKAFTDEFGDDPNVRLVLKTVKMQLPFPLLKSEYPNIDVIKQGYNATQMVKLLGECDCLVFPSRGEGMGLPPLECMATGMPVIVTNGSGMTEYAKPDYFSLVDVKGPCPAIYNNYDPKDVGDFVEPCIDSLKRQMRWVYEHQAEARDMAAKGSKYVAKRYSMAVTVKALETHLHAMADDKQIVDKVVETVANMLKSDFSNVDGGQAKAMDVLAALHARFDGQGSKMTQPPALEVKTPPRPPREAALEQKPVKKVDKQFGVKKPIKKRG